MDPTETLRLAREAMEQGDHESAADLFSALDEWVTKGGFLPSQWWSAMKGSRNA